MSVENVMFLEAAQQLREATRKGRTFESAQVKVIGLEEIRQAAGRTWPMISDRIRATSMQFLQDHLRPDDLVIPAGDGFLIIYAESEDRNFETESDALRTALNNFFLGRSQTARLRADVTHKRVDSSGLVSLIGDPAAPHDGELSFLPVWNARQEAVTGYWLAPSYRAGGQRHFGYDQSWTDTRVHSEVDYLSLDIEIAERAAEEAQRSLDSGRRCLIGYSVHASTMQFRQRRREYLATLYTIGEKLRPYLVGRIAEIEPGTPMTSMSEWVHQLRPVNSLVALQLHESDRALAGLNSTGAFSVSFTLHARQCEPAAKQSYKRSIARWSQALAKQRLRLRLDNVTDADLLAVAIENQVDLFSSEAMWPPVDEPKGVYLFSKDQFGAMLSMM